MPARRGAGIITLRADDVRLRSRKPDRVTGSGLKEPPETSFVDHTAAGPIPSPEVTPCRMCRSTESIAPMANWVKFQTGDALRKVREHCRPSRS
jgi:hypothetical protein